MKKILIIFALGAITIACSKMTTESFEEPVDNGYITTFDGVHTTRKRIYAAGDARVKDLRQLVTACSDGAIAATTAIKEMGD